jgi:hypothetical protein
MKVLSHILLISLTLLLSCSQKKDNDKAELDQVAIDSINYLDSSSYALINSIIDGENSKYQIRIYDSIPQVNNNYKFLLDEQSFKALKNPPSLINLKGNLTLYRLDSTKLPRAKILPPSSIDFNKPYQENKHLKPFWIIYSPIISKDDQTAVISIDNICFGLCGEGWTLLLKKEDGKWVVLEKFHRWIG